MRLFLKPTGHWAVDFEDPATGKRRRVSTGLRDKAEARRKARDIMMGLDGAPAPAPRTPKAPEGTSMDALWRRCELTIWSPSECRSQDTIKSALKVFRALDVPGLGRLADVMVGDLTYTRLELVMAAFKAKGYAPGTTRRNLAMIGRSLSMAEQWGLIPVRPRMPGLKVENQRTRVLTYDEEGAVLDALDAMIEEQPARDLRRFKCLIRFLLDVGCRLGEALGVRVSDLEEQDGQWYVDFRRYETKNGKPRRIPLTPAVVATLPYLREASCRGYVFPITASTVWYMWDGVRDRVKADAGFDLADVVIHSLRHTCITRLAKRLPIHIVSLWAGHSDVKITASVYTHLNAEDLLAGVAALSSER